MIRVFKNIDQLSEATAEMFVDIANQAIDKCKRFSVALSGGNTPRRLYQLLVDQPFRDLIPWKFVHIFWGDERCVLANDPRSNTRMVRQILLDHVPIPSDNIHWVPVELPPAQVAKQYESDLRSFFGEKAPVFDLILLGMGENAHTASLFPHSPVLSERVAWVAEVYVADQDIYRITFTVPLINQADQVIFLVSGSDKANTLHQVLEGAYQPQEFPAQLIRPHGANPIWMIDEAASHKLTGVADNAL